MTQDERINAISVNPHMATIDDIADLAATVQEQRERIAELEAANQWHSASEPPPLPATGLAEAVEVQYANGHVSTSYYNYKCRYWPYAGIVRWRDLPPTQGKESTGLRDTDWERDA